MTPAPIATQPSAPPPPAAEPPPAPTPPAPKAAGSGRDQGRRRRRRRARRQGRQAPPPRRSTSPRRRARARSPAASRPPRLEPAALQQPIDGRGHGARDFIQAGAGVDDDGARVAGDQVAVASGDAFLNGVGVVAFVDAARGAAARGGDRHRQVEQQRQVGLAQVARQRRDPGARRPPRPGTRATTAGSDRRRRPGPPRAPGSISRRRWSRRSAANSSAMAVTVGRRAVGQAVIADAGSRAAGGRPGRRWARGWRGRCGRAPRRCATRRSSWVVVPEPSIPSRAMKRGGA